jgi:hypothetical protein
VAKKMVQSGTGVLPDIWKPFGPGPVLSTEDRKAYEEMRWRLTHTLQLGDDFIEIMLAGTVINLTWEKLRYVRLKKALIELAHHKRLVLEAKDIELAAPIHHIMRVREAKKAGKPVPEPEDVSHRVKALWDRPPALIEHAQAMQDCLDDFERLDKLDIAVEVRLRAALGDLERYRNGLGRQLRQAIQQVIDGEANELPAAATAVSSTEVPVPLVEAAGSAPVGAPVDDLPVAPLGVSPDTETFVSVHVLEYAAPSAASAPTTTPAAGELDQHPPLTTPAPAAVADDLAASGAAIAPGSSAGNLITEIEIPHTVDEPAPLEAAPESADADLVPTTRRMSPGIITAHDSNDATTTAPQAVEVLLLDTDAQVPPDPNGVG